MYSTETVREEPKQGEREEEKRSRLPAEPEAGLDATTLGS